jgi:hypothetical protein
MLGKEREHELLREAQRIQAGASVQMVKRVRWRRLWRLLRRSDRLHTTPAAVRADDAA